MKKIGCVYHSKYGATKQYADWLKEEIDCVVYDGTKNASIAYDDYDVIIFAGGIYATGISGIRTLKKEYEKIKNKEVIVLAVGASPYDEDALQQIKERNLNGESMDIPVFYARGKFDLSSMNLKDRTLCKMLKKMVQKKKTSDLEPWMIALLEAEDEHNDFLDRSQLEPLLTYVKTAI